MHRRLRARLGWAILTAGAAAALAALPLTQPTRADAPPPKDFKAYTETVPATNVSFDMLPIPAGEFLMGSPTAEKGREPDEGPQHPVKVGAFWMAKVETTWDLYDLYWKDEGIVEGDK